LACRYVLPIRELQGLKQHPLEIQDGGGRHLGFGFSTKSLSDFNEHISIKFGAQTDIAIRLWRFGHLIQNQMPMTIKK